LLFFQSRKRCFLENLIFTSQNIDEMARLLIYQRLGLNDQEKKFLELIKKHGVRVNQTKAGKEDKGFQELVALLSSLHKQGAIPHFEVVEV